MSKTAQQTTIQVIIAETVQEYGDGQGGKTTVTTYEARLPNEPDTVGHGGSKPEAIGQLLLNKGIVKIKT